MILNFHAKQTFKERDISRIITRLSGVENEDVYFFKIAGRQGSPRALLIPEDPSRSIRHYSSPRWSTSRMMIGKNQVLEEAPCFYSPNMGLCFGVLINENPEKYEPATIEALYDYTLGVSSQAFPEKMGVGAGLVLFAVGLLRESYPVEPEITDEYLGQKFPQFDKYKLCLLKEGFKKSRPGHTSVHFCYASQGEGNWLRNSAGIHNNIVVALVRKSQRRNLYNSSGGLEYLKWLNK